MSEARPRGRRRLWLGLQIVGTIVALGFVASMVELDEVGEAMARGGFGAFALAMTIVAVNLELGALRWGVLLRAYGATELPSFWHLSRVYWVGFFYNSYLPGGLGGDVVRGLVTKRAFGPGGTTPSMTVVLVERVLGLSGLLSLTTATLLYRPLPGTEGVVGWSAIGLALAVASVVGVALGRRLAGVLPGRLGQLAASLPTLVKPSAFALAFGLSLGTQALVALTGYVLLVAIEPNTAVTDALTVVPVAMAASYFPLSVGGAGAREAAFVALGTVALGMTRSDAFAASLLLWATQLAVAAFGGLAQIGLSRDTADDEVGEPPRVEANAEAEAEPPEAK